LKIEDNFIFLPLDDFNDCAQADLCVGIAALVGLPGPGSGSWQAIQKLKTKNQKPNLQRIFKAAASADMQESRL